MWGGAVAPVGPRERGRAGAATGERGRCWVSDCAAPALPLGAGARFRRSNAQGGVHLAATHSSQCRRPSACSLPRCTSRCPRTLAAAAPAAAPGREGRLSTPRAATAMRRAKGAAAPSPRRHSPSCTPAAADGRASTAASRWGGADVWRGCGCAAGAGCPQALAVGVLLCSASGAKSCCPLPCVALTFDRMATPGPHPAGTAAHGPSG